jgi:hypothetical protein
MVEPREPDMAVDVERVEVVTEPPRALEPPSTNPPRALPEDRGAGGGALTRADAEGIVRTCLSIVMARAAGVLVDAPLAAIVDDVVAEEACAAEVDAAAVVAAETALTLLFTKRCSLPS